MVEANPEIADLLYEEERAGVEELERKLRKRLSSRARPDSTKTNSTSSRFEDKTVIDPG